MSERKADHGSFTIERKFDAPPALVYSAFATEKGKQAWFSGPNDLWSLEDRAFDFRVGGSETLSGKWKTGRITRFDAHYHDIVPDERIIYSYTMHVDDRKISVSLATLEFKKSGAGTLLVLNEQGAFLDGYDDAGSRERGTIGLIEKLEAAIRDGKLQ
ncbi:MAG TPA: SRPBCC family protein [Rhizomicrobium sp.]|nr:SRPBCC family protein [Rhizomicrobium sp.]